MKEYDEISNNAFKLLNKGVDVFNEWRMENPDVRLDFSDSEFNLQSFEGACLFNVDLSNSKFSECVLDNVIFCSSNLDNVRIINSRAMDAVFGIPELINASLNQNVQDFLRKPASLKNAYLRANNFNGSVFREANIEGADFKFTKLEYGDFRNTNFHRANFEKALLGKTIFKGKEFE